MVYAIPAEPGKHRVFLVRVPQRGIIWVHSMLQHGYTVRFDAKCEQFPDSSFSARLDVFGPQTLLRHV